MRYNSWILIEVVSSRKAFIKEDVLAYLEVTLHGSGRRMYSQVQDGRFGSYTVYDDCYDYYIVKWYGTPWESEKYEAI